MKKHLILAAIIFTFLYPGSESPAETESAAQLASLAGAGPELTQPNPDMTIDVRNDSISSRVSLDLRNIEIVEALKYLAVKAKWNIIVTKSVEGRVTLTVEDAPIADVLDIMLRSNGLAYAKQGDIYNVMTESEYKALYGKKFSDVRVVKVLRLKYAIPEQAFALIDTIKSDVGKILVNPESGTVMIMDTPDKIKQAEEALKLLEQKSVIRIFSLKYARAKDIAEQLKIQLDAKKVGLVRADPRANQVIVQALPDRMGDIEKIIAGLDKKTKEVMISTRIIQVYVSDASSQGISWEGIFNILTNSSEMTYFGSYPFSAVQATTDAWRSRKQVLDDIGYIGGYPSSGFTTNYKGQKNTGTERMHVGTVGDKADYDVLIRYLETIGKTKVLSNPSLAVIDSEEAKIHIGEKQAYVTTTKTISSNTTTVAEEITYLDIGVQLTIKPLINDDGYIIMEIKPEISSISDYVTTPSGNEIPILNTSTTKTTVMVKDGATIVIGGLSRQESTDAQEKTPLLGDIPVAGNAFKTRDKRLIRSELIILVTPIIIEGDKPVTADSAESQGHGPKPPKKFDVFREELQHPRKTGTDLYGDEDPLAPKEAKNYW